MIGIILFSPGQTMNLNGSGLWSTRKKLRIFPHSLIISLNIQITLMKDRTVRSLPKSQK